MQDQNPTPDFEEIMQSMPDPELGSEERRAERAAKRAAQPKRAKKRKRRNLAAAFDKQITIRSAIIACALCAVLAVVFTTLVNYAGFGGAKAYKMARKLATVRSVVDKNYIGDTDDEALTNAAASAIVSATGDRWSYYMTPEDYQAFQMYSANEYAGIGVTLQAGAGSSGLQIVAVAAQSPAEKAGLKVGEAILEVDGESVSGKTLSEVQAQIRAKVNQTISFTIRGDDPEPRTVKVDCTVIHTDPVSFEMLDGQVGYVKINNFESGAGSGALKAVDSLLADGAKSLVFDVRGNPGGRITELVTILDHLLPEGDLFVSVDKSGKETVTTSDNICVKVPMCVLVDASSYSAAEYFAAALQEYNWATIVGEATTGKGRSQVTLVLKDGSAIHLSTARYLTPNRVDLSEQGGLTPDIKALAGAEDSELDLQLEEALKVLKS